MTRIKDYQPESRLNSQPDCQVDSLLDNLIVSVPKEIAPSNDNWQAIAARLDKPLAIPNRAKPSWHLAMAAAIMLLVLFPLLKPAPVPKDDALQLLIKDIDQTHQQQITLLSTHSQLAWQDAGFSDKVDAGLTELRGASTLILDALEASPQDKKLWQLWLWVQRREIELLTQKQRLPQGNIQGERL